MNVASILPLAAPRSGGGSATTAVPEGFLAALAAQHGGDEAATAELTGDASDLPEGAASSPDDLLALVALACRSAHAALPHGTVPVAPLDAEVVTDEAGEVVVTGPDAGSSTAADALVDDGADIEVGPEVIEGMPATTGVPATEGGPATEATLETDGTLGTEHELGTGPTDAAATPSSAGSAAPTTAAPVTTPSESTAAPATNTAAATTASEPVTRAASANGGTPPSTASEPLTAGTATTTPVPGPEVDAEAPAHAVPSAGATPRVTETTSDDVAASPTLATADGDEPMVQRAAASAVGDRGRGRVEATAPRVTLDADGALSTEALGADGTDALGTVGAGGTGSTGRSALATPSAAAQRVLDIVTQLEDAPPPRVVVIETGEIRVRIGLDGGVVRMTVLGEPSAAGEEVLQEAADALEADGFGTELDRSSGDETRGDGDPPAEGRHQGDGVPAATTTERPSQRPRAGLQL